MRCQRWVGVLMVGAALLALIWPVKAHTQLLKAFPAAGETLETPPTEIRLLFSEPNGANSTIALFGANFRRIDAVQTTVDPMNSAQLIATVPPLEPGVYTVQWTTFSLDAHQLTGSYSFGVDTAVPGESKWLVGMGTAVFALTFILVAWKRVKRTAIPLKRSSSPTP